MSRFGALKQLGGRKASKAEAADAEAQSGVGGSLTRASELINEVVRAAERAAEQITADADSRGEGRASVIDRERVASELMKSLAERTDKLRSEAHELARVLERAAPLMQAATETAAAQPPAPPTTQQPVVPPLPPSANETPYGPASGSVPPPSVSPGAVAPQPPPPAPQPPPAAPQPPPATPDPRAHQPMPPAPVAEPVTQVEPAPAPENPSFGTSTAVAEPPAEETVAEPAPLQPLGGSRRKAQPHPSEGIRLLATQMAVAGSSHHEIEERLRREFGVSDADAIIAEVFGARE